MENILNCFIETKAPEKIYKLKWTVESVSNLPERENIESPEFYVENNNNAWNVRFVKESTCVSVVLYRCAKKSSLQIVCEVKVLDCNNKVFYEKTVSAYKNGTLGSITLTFPDITLKGLKKAPNDTWYFIFTIRTSKITTVKKFENKSQQMCSYFADFWKKFEGKIRTDVTLQVQGDKIEAHKFVLSAQSPVFAKMFETPMSESEKDAVVIDDVSKEAIALLIKFLYSGLNIECSFEMGVELYYAADKYEVFELRELCGKILLSKLTIDNAGMLLEMADKHMDSSFKSNVMEFINSNIKSCIKKDWWYDLISKKTELAKELMGYIH